MDKVDKSLWYRGAWDNEVDQDNWTSVEGYPCTLTRNGAGSLCGYVGIPQGHPAYGEKYDSEILSDIFAHGGLTYSAIGRETYNEKPDHWYIGFDCAHSGDYSPASSALRHKDPSLAELFKQSPHEIYRDFSYVTEQVRQLAEQLECIKKGLPWVAPKRLK